MAELTVYEKSACTTCRNLAALLAERGVEIDRVEYHVEGLSEDKLRELLRKADAGPHEFLRRREALAGELGIDDATPDEELIRLMAQHPQIVQRPIVERGDRAVLARPVERVLDLL